MVTNEVKDTLEHLKYSSEQWLNFEFEFNEPFSNWEKLIIVGDNIADLHIIPAFKLRSNNKPTSKEIRLTTDIVKEQYPLWAKSDPKVLAGFVKDIFKYDTSIERLARVTPMKRVLFRKVITIKKNKVILKRVRKHVGLIASEKPKSRPKRSEIYGYRS